MKHTPHLFANPASCSLGHVHRENGVTPVRVFVEVVHGGCAHQLAPVQKVQSLLLGLHLYSSAGNIVAVRLCQVV